MSRANDNQVMARANRHTEATILTRSSPAHRLRPLLRRSTLLVTALVLSACALAPQREPDVFASVMGDALARESGVDAKDSGKERTPRTAARARRWVVIPEELRGAEPVRSASVRSSDVVTARMLTAPTRPSSTEPYSSGGSTSDLWSRLRAGFQLPDLNTPLVQNREQWHTAHADDFQRMSERGRRYLFHILEEVERRRMPAELALLPFIESAFNPQALSSAQASGIWQFIPTTGVAFDLRQNIFRDDRRDVLASTRAALDYLSKLHGLFGDWHLALAAYNWGESNVQRAIQHNRRAGLPTDYLSLRMPEETRYYLPKLQAVKNIVARPEAYGVRLPELSNQPYFASVAIERDIDIALAIELSGVQPDEFMKLNPQFNKPVILAAGTPQLLLPRNSAARFVGKLKEYSGPRATWTAWTAPRTVRLNEVAQELGVSESVLREVNAIPPSMLINRGSTLLVPRGVDGQADVPLHLADNAVMSLTREASSRRR